MPGLNDSDEHLDRAYALSRHADATVFTGLFYRDQIAAYYQASGLPEPYEDTARRKIVPETLEQRVLAAFAGLDLAVPQDLLRRVASSHGLPDYNGHPASAELCDICPLAQLDLCRKAHRVPTAEPDAPGRQRAARGRSLVVVDISERAAIVSGLDAEQPRYYLQHALGFQVHDVRHPHHTTAMAGQTSDGRTRRTMTDWTSLRYAVVDVEGNGQQPPDLVELAVVPIAGGIIGEPASWLVRPDAPIRHFATRIHGITNDDVASAPAFADIAARGTRGAGRCRPSLRTTPTSTWTSCSRKLAAGSRPRSSTRSSSPAVSCPASPVTSSARWSRRFHLADGLPGGLAPHRAEYDALVTARLFVQLATSPDGSPSRSTNCAAGNPPGRGGDDAPSLF